MSCHPERSARRLSTDSLRVGRARSRMDLLLTSQYQPPKGKGGSAGLQPGDELAHKNRL